MKRMCLNCCEIINHEGDVINHACDNLNIGVVSDIPCYQYVDGVGAVYACATTCAGLPNCGRNAIGSVPPSGKDVIWAMGKSEPPNEEGYYLCKIESFDAMARKAYSVYVCYYNTDTKKWDKGRNVVRWWDLKDFE